MKTVVLSFIFSVAGVVGAYAMGCSHDGLDPASACPVGTVYNSDTGACDTVTT
ncbi:MAG: hypothetical protein AAFR98_13565 [Pseudomonadota bacterium]